MQIKRFPNGILEYNDGKLTISGGEASIIPVKDISEIICRDGKKSVFSRNPPLIAEITFKAGANENKTKLMIDKDEKDKMLELIRIIDIDKNH